VQRILLRLNEVEAVGEEGVHAEIKAIQLAQRLGLDIYGVAASRPICEQCAPAILRAGGQLLSGSKIVP
jgi:hypothetical protein